MLMKNKSAQVTVLKYISLQAFQQQKPYCKVGGLTGKKDSWLLTQGAMHFCVARKD